MRRVYVPLSVSKRGACLGNPSEAFEIESVKVYRMFRRVILKHPRWVNVCFVFAIFYFMLESTLSVRVFEPFERCNYNFQRVFGLIELCRGAQTSPFRLRIRILIGLLKYTTTGCNIYRFCQSALDYNSNYDGFCRKNWMPGRGHQLFSIRSPIIRIQFQAPEIRMPSLKEAELAWARWSAYIYLAYRIFSA